MFKAVALFFVMLGMSFHFNFQLKSNPSPIPSAPESVTQISRRSTHHIIWSSLSEAAGCSATAVGSHVILTASHCEVPSSVIHIDDADYHILRLIRDNNDHTLLLVDATFKDFSPIVERTPIDEENVFIFGNPGSSRNVYRVGSYESEDKSMFRSEDKVQRTMYFYLLPIFPGDSGSAIFDTKGNIIAVASLGNSSAEAVSFMLAFTPDQLAIINSN